MYALPKGPSKIAANTRRGLQRQFESFESREFSLGKNDPGAAMSAPRPVFNGKRPTSRQNSSQQEQFSQQHEECVRYLSENWNKVMREYEQFKEGGKEGGPEWYKEKNPNPHLADFKPFDLEEYWGHRTMRRLTESS
ncbi:hypothetical protein C0Q70_00980 [Pomacea canaliculata]|uniref:MAPK regulated corepressor interacting protein 2 n=1 Tax=Pomacea canaliculata TaxID=400727 RepID=A0A2T7PY66_POMCA|nr:mapk-regulated corepressor-interacting protein 1-like [Pomacea canaliculata]PVD38366.1 hypothetical protein C0Q70_00980 [Pomacea canaliculata]